MSIVVHIFYSGQNGNARRFAEEMRASGTVAQIRAEAGNEGYSYFYPQEAPETVLLIDKWASQDALDAHHATPMMAAITTLREKYGLTMQVERYISDAGGIPERDKKFIRT